MYVCVYNWSIWNTYRQVLKDSKLPMQMVQTSDKPTRRVQVTRDTNGDRAFAGFEGGASLDSFADCDVAVSKISGTWLYAADYLGQSSQMSVHSAFMYTKRFFFFIVCG